jgi:exodeoxyribonuclease VII small subunit
MAKKRTAVGDTDEPTFEEAMASLEAIVRRLEQGGGPLEEALGDYSTAIGLLKTCNGRLENAERRVEILSGVDAQGNPVTRPIDDSESTLEEKQQSRSNRRSAASNKTRTNDDTDTVGLF